MGLLFVSLSLHIEVVAEDGKAHLSVIAREAFASFLIVLLVALLMLSNAMSRRSLAAALLTIGVIRVMQVGFRFLRSSAPDAHDRKLGRVYVLIRFVMPVVSYLALALSGWVLFCGDLDDALGLVMLSCVLLI